MQPPKASGAPAPSRHTPDPAKVRLAMSGLFLIGLLAGGLGALLPLWAFELSLDSVDAGNALMVLSVGAFVGGTGALRYGQRNDRVRKLFLFSALAIALCLIAASQAGNAGDLVFPMAGLGLGAGAVAGLVAGLMEGCLTDRRAADVLHLSGVAFGFGAIGACSLAWLLNGISGSSSLLWAIAAIAVLTGLTSRRGQPVQIAPIGSAVRDVARIAWTPGGVLLAAGVFVQAANSGIAGSWLGLYVFRKLGVSLEWSLTILIGYWATATSVRAMAVRIPERVGRVLPALAVTGIALLGALFLLQTVQASGALAGAILLGAGAGAAHPLTLRAVRSRILPAPTGFARIYATGSFLAALGSAWAMGPISTNWGINAVAWGLLLGVSVAFAALGLLLLESRLSHSPAGAR